METPVEPLPSITIFERSMTMKTKKILAWLAAAAPLGALAQEQSVTVPGLADAITTAENTATSMASSLVPAAVTIVFAFAGILGVWAVWKLLRRGVRGA